MIADCHSHHYDPATAIFDASGHDEAPAEGYFSAGIHPWYTSEVDDTAWIRLQSMLAHPRCIAIGETGLDATRGASMDKQIEIFSRIIQLSEQLQLPLIIHCVRAYHILLQLHKQYRPRQKWLVHGFRGNRATLQSLHSKGISVSFGPLFNPLALQSVDTEQLLIETDDADMSINDVAMSIAIEKNTTTQSILAASHRNISDIFLLPLQKQ